MSFPNSNKRFRGSCLTVFPVPDPNIPVHMQFEFPVNCWVESCLGKQNLRPFQMRPLDRITQHRVWMEVRQKIVECSIQCVCVCVCVQHCVFVYVCVCVCDMVASHPRRTETKPQQHPHPPPRNLVLCKRLVTMSRSHHTCLKFARRFRLFQVGQLLYYYTLWLFNGPFLDGLPWFTYKKWWIFPWLC